MSFLENAWYTIAWKSELEAGAMLARTVLNTPVTLFRDPDGTVRALRDVCPHRMAPLSAGTLDNGVVSCPYHGLKFNGHGQCVHNPHGDGRIPPRAQVQTFPILEKYHAIWIWMGDPEKADPAALPDFSFMDEETTYSGAGYLHIDANYRLEIDNILDLSHIEFVHPLFSSPAVSKAETDWRREGDRVWSIRDILNDADFPEFVRQGFHIPPDVDVIDRWLDVSWDAPALLSLHMSAAPTGTPKDQAFAQLTMAGPHWFTPETESSTHYFYAFVLPKAMGEQARHIVEQATADSVQPFKYEDKPLIEAQARVLGDRDLMDCNPIILPGDAPAVWARRILAQKIDEEQAAKAEQG